MVRKLPPVERESRLTKLREKLPGVDLTRHQEPSYELVGAFSAMLEARAVRWVPFHKCASREQELSACLFNKELQVTQSHDGKLSLKEGQASRRTNVSDGLRVQQAMSRRAAAAEVALPLWTPCKSGTRTSSILLRNSPHKVSHRLLWSSSRQQTRRARALPGRGKADPAAHPRVEALRRRGRAAGAREARRQLMAAGESQGGHQQPAQYCGLRLRRGTRIRELPEEHDMLRRWCEALGQEYRGQRLAGLAHEIFLKLLKAKREVPGAAERQPRRTASARCAAAG